METALIISPQTAVEIQPDVVHFRRDGLLIVLLHEEQLRDIGCCIADIVESGSKTLIGNYDFVGVIERSGLSTYLLYQYCDFMGTEELTVIDGVIAQGSICSADLQLQGETGSRRLGIHPGLLAETYRNYWYWEEEFRIEKGLVTREEAAMEKVRYREELALRRQLQVKAPGFGQKLRRFFGKN